MQTVTGTAPKPSESEANGQSFDITALLHGLAQHGLVEARRASRPLPTEGGGTTIRFDPELRAFLETMRHELVGMSLQSVVSLLLTGVMRASLTLPRESPASCTSCGAPRTR